MFNELAIKLAAAKVVLESKVEEFMYNEDGEVNVIAMIVILAIAIALAVVFRKQIKELFDKIFAAIQGNTDQALTTF